MTCRSISLFLLVTIVTTGASAQVSGELALYGLDAPDPNKLKQKVTELEHQQEMAAIDAMRVLVADTTLVTRAFEYYVAKRRDAGREVNRDHEYQRAVHEVVQVVETTQRAVRRLAFMRDTGIFCAFDLPDSALAMLADQGAVVMPWTKNEMYEWYDRNYPFVTTDLVYHTFMILVRAAIDELENLSFSEELVGLTREWSASCLELAKGLEPDLAQLSKDNAALLAVATILASGGGTALIDDLGLDATRRSHVEAEVSRVREATYFGFSPLLGEDEDYTEYRARGRASGKQGVGYFRARHWLARAVFPVDDTQATQRALLLTEALARRQTAWDRWELLDRTAAQLAGPRDDPDVRMYLNLAEQVTGEKGIGALRTVLDNDDSFTRFGNEAAHWAVPLIDDSPARGRQNILGLRLLAQRRSADGILLQRLTEEGVWPVTGLQVMAGLFEIPDEGPLLNSLGLELPASASSVEAGSIGLMSGYRACHAALFDTPEGLPSLFKSRIWRDKQVNSALGAWAESRHAAAPYLKSAHLYMGMTMEKPKLQGYVEPYPEFYRRLKNEVRLWDTLCRESGVYGAVASQIASDPESHRLDEGRFPDFMEILDVLEVLAASELKGEPQTENDGQFLKRLGTRLRNLCFNHSSMNISEEPMSRIIDVATEYQSRQVLEVGVGMAHALFVAVNHGDETVVCRGSVYGYHELMAPVLNRLDDSVWEGVSAGTVLFGRGPWLDGVSPLYYGPHLSAAELEAILETPRSRVGGKRGLPWNTEIHGYRPVPPWVGVRVRNADTALLVKMVEREDLNPDLLRFATRELSRHGDFGPVLDFWRRVVDGIVEQGRLRGAQDIDAIRLFWALQVLAQNGNSDDRDRLGGVTRVLDAGISHRKGTAGREPALRWLLNVASESCGSGVSPRSN